MRLLLVLAPQVPDIDRAEGLLAVTDQLRDVKSASAAVEITLR